MRKAILALCACALLSGCPVATMLRGGGENNPRFSALIRNASEHYIIIDDRVSTQLDRGQGASIRFKKEGVHMAHIRAYEIAGRDERGEVTKGPLVWEEDFPLIVDGVVRDYCGEVADTALVIAEAESHIGEENDCFKLYIPTLFIEPSLFR